MEKYKGLSSIPKLDLDKKEDFDDIVILCNALGNAKRLSILQELNKPPFTLSVSELTKRLNMPTSTLMHHLQILSDASLVHYRYQNSPNGAIRIYGRSLRGADLRFYHIHKDDNKNRKCDIQSLRVGQFINYEGDTFSFVTATKMYDFLGSNCFSPYRFDAELVYSPFGIIEYYFDNITALEHNVDALTFSLEICSEAPYFDNNYKSEITFWINNKEVGTHICNGDYGDRRGKLNPDWWRDTNTQYGKIVTVSVDTKGVHIDGLLVNDKVKIDDLNLSHDNKISFKFGNKKTATYPGGFNVFGKGFGDHAQDIVLQLFYVNEEN